MGSKQAFEVSLADVAQAQPQGKTDVYLEFHVDDTTGANEVSDFGSCYYVILLDSLDHNVAVLYISERFINGFKFLCTEFKHTIHR